MAVSILFSSVNINWNLVRVVEWEKCVTSCRLSWFKMEVEKAPSCVPKFIHFPRPSLKKKTIFPMNDWHTSTHKRKSIQNTGHCLAHLQKPSVHFSNTFTCHFRILLPNYWGEQRNNLSTNIFAQRELHLLILWIHICHWFSYRLCRVV